MTFMGSAEDVRVDDGRILRARLQNVDGEWVDAEFDLNNIIGNIDGNFAWDGQGFADSAENIWLSIEGDNQPILRASLFDSEGNTQDRDINLAERLGNNNGEFSYN